jgi:hypothetical protein
LIIMNSNDPTSGDNAFEEALTLAREYRPDTGGAEFGFTTRLSARISELRREGEAPGRSLWDEAIAWLWGGAAGAAPVVAGLAIWFFVANGLELRFDGETGFDSLYHHLSAYLPSFSLSGS